MPSDRNGKISRTTIAILGSTVVALLTYAITTSGAASVKDVAKNRDDITCIKERLGSMAADIRWIRENLHQ